jgi:transposase
VVADRGLLSLDNVEALSKIEVARDQALEFILAVPGRRYADFEEVLQPLQAQIAERPAAATSEFIGETRWQERRLVVAHNPERAREQTAQRRSRIQALQARAEQLAGKLDAQDAGQARRGRKLSDSGAKARFFHEVCDAHLTRIVKVDLKAELFTFDIDAEAQQRAELMDGKLLLVTNVADLSATQIVERYKALADIERGFRVLKSEIEIAPVLHRLPPPESD